MEKIYEFWFGSKNKSDFKQKQDIWFKNSNETDNLIISLFTKILQEGEEGKLDDWEQNSYGALALVILFDQISKKIYRGTSKMYSNDAKALQIAENLLKKENNFTTIEIYFIYNCFLNSENLRKAEKGLDGIKKLHDSVDFSQKEIYKRSKKQYDVLFKYGRYPNRNELLHRDSTPGEKKYLKKKKNKIFKSDEKRIDTEMPFQNILFLHGYRQSSNKIKKRVSVPLVQKIKTNLNAQITFLNGTHPYKPTITNTVNSFDLNMIESQRCWYNLHNETDLNPITANEINESLAYVLNHSKTPDGRPVYDGIIGFSQGSVIASILVRKYPNLFRYFISISGYQTKLIKYSNMFTEQFNFPSLHIYGLNDKMVDPSRSILFSKSFTNSQIEIHDAGHFAPDSWPVGSIMYFIKSQSLSIKPTIESFKHITPKIESFKLCISEINNKLLRYNLNDLNLEKLFSTDDAVDIYKLIKKSNTFNKDYSFYQDRIDFNDKLMLVYYLILKNKSKKNKIVRNTAEDESVKSILKLFINDLNNDLIDIMFIQPQHWYELIYLYDLAYEFKFDLINEFILIKLADQLKTDLMIMDRGRRTNHLVTLILNSNNRKQEIKDVSISNLAFYFPRIKSSIDKRSRLARDCANQLNTYKNVLNTNIKITSYNNFRKVLSILTDYIKKINDYDTNPRVHFNLARSNKIVLQSLIDSNLFSDAILNPIPEPVDISSRDEMQPLYDWLAKSKTLSKLNENDLKFLKGTITIDGRLDLCKQVIGPTGTKPLLDSLLNSQHVDRILLGNNVIGDDGAQLIADFISSGQSNIKIWYIAGNNITSVGLNKIVKVLINDTLVTGLWLKRNPLKLDGMYPISNLLINNKLIQVLDLINCGILDSGASIIFDALKSNQSLKHLYLSANGITPVGLQHMLDYFKSVHESKLETLFLGCNRIGNTGSKLISECLEYAPNLKRLNLASSRIDSEGMKYLCDGLKISSLKVLDLGYMRSSMDLGELNNFIEDEGCIYLSDLFKKNSIDLISLNITHNHISKIGFEILVDSIENNKTLTFLDYNQFGVHFNTKTINLLKSFLKRNNELLDETIIKSLIIPDHVREIYSVYRTH
jgi:uncharacterized protein (DUF924 family)/Ran GTPase-activating protein (RanGAP) involved in mRNA processing and transport/predicted esterase